MGLDVPAVEGEGCGEMKLNPDFWTWPWSDYVALSPTRR